MVIRRWSPAQAEQACETLPSPTRVLVAGRSTQYLDSRGEITVQAQATVSLGSCSRHPARSGSPSGRSS